MGGFMSGKFALNYPQRIQHLILVDPFGVNEALPTEVVAARSEQRKPLEKLRNKVVEKLFYGVAPLCPIRGLGPLGPKVIRPKLQKKCEQWKGHTEDDNAVADYLYHANARSPSGEIAFSKCMVGMGAHFGDGFNAKFPLCHELPRLDPAIPMHIIYGSHTWIPHNGGYQVARLRQERYEDAVAVAEATRTAADTDAAPVAEMPAPLKPVTEVIVVPRAGHHVYLENSTRFNGVMQEIISPGSRKRERPESAGWPESHQVQAPAHPDFSPPKRTPVSDASVLAAVNKSESVT